jgi:queuine tRNA-ribosyltransferase accessory subunit
MLVIPCKRGGVPNLTPAMLRDIVELDERMLSLSVFDAAEHTKLLVATNKSFAAFCCLDEFKVLLNVRSPFIGTHTSAPSSEQSIAGDHDTGRIVVSVKKLNDIATSIRPDWMVGLSDSGCLDEQPPSKKRRTATDRSCRWFQSFVSGDDAPVGAQNILVPATVARNGKPDVQTAGLYMDMVNQNEPLGLRLAFVRETIERFGSEMSVSHAESVPAMLGLVAAGVTHVESALPWQLASKGKALCLPHSMESLSQALSETPSDRGPPVIDLNDPTYCWDKATLSAGYACRCYTCCRHTRCYIHHLLTVQEMNSEILLVIHNLTQVVDMLRLVRHVGDEQRQRTIARFLSLFQV